MAVLYRILSGYDAFVLCYFVLVCAVYFIKLTLASLEVLDHQRRRSYAGHDEVFGSPLTPAITVISPAFNEAAGIIDSIRALFNLRYPHYDVLVINDGSTDATMDVLKREFALRRIDAVYSPRIPTERVRGVYVSTTYPSLTVVDKNNGGKADALNCGINLARTPLFCSVDADSVLDPDALLRGVKPFVDKPEMVVAAGGIIGVANGATIEGGSIIRARLSHVPVVTFQVLEYLRSFLVGCASGSRTNNLLIISGAFALYRRDLVVAAGGYRVGVVGEDAEMTTRLHRYLLERRRPYHLVAIPDLVCWTEVPETLRILGRQRRRWHHGLAETLLAHRRMLLNPRYGSVGLTGYTYLFVVELFAPVVECTGYVLLLLSILLGALDVEMSLLLLAVAIGYGVFLSLGALILEELGYRYYPGWRDLLRLSAFALFECAGYRQLTVFWRLQGLWDVVRRNHTWGVMERKGLSSASRAA